jgi:ribosome-associated protein
VSITPRARELIVAAAEAAADKLAEDIVAFDVSEQLVITDAFLICSAPNDRQVKSIVDAVEERLRAMGAKPARREGEREARWVLLDYVDIIVHVQHAEERIFYSLERIWKDCPTVELPDEVRRGRSRHDHPAVTRHEHIAGDPHDSSADVRDGTPAGSSARGAAS